VDLSTSLVLVASRSSWASGCARAENHMHPVLDNAA
jgi:hypothetical protein